MPVSACLAAVATISSDMPDAADWLATLMGVLDTIQQ
jgi:hypothetical protein